MKRFFLITSTLFVGVIARLIVTDCLCPDPVHCPPIFGGPNGTNYSCPCVICPEKGICPCENGCRMNPELYRNKRESDGQVKVYPSPGTWYKDTDNDKYYFHLGNTVYVERNDNYYSKWVTSGNGAKWSLNDNFLYKWDNTGKWFAVKEDDGKRDNGECNVPPNKFEIPVKCLAGKCPNQIRFPSDGVWYAKDGEKFFVYDDGKARYEIQPNLFYRKFLGEKQICPDNWSWNFETGEWYPLMSSERSDCSMEDPSPPNGGPTREREGLLPPPKDVFMY